MKCAKIIQFSSLLATLALVGVTYGLVRATNNLVTETKDYVSLTRDLVSSQSAHLKKQEEQINNQREQFEIVNRPKVLCSIEGSRLNGGTILFGNAGNLPAEDLTFFWQIFKIEGSQEKAKYPNEVKVTEHEVLDPEEIKRIPYITEFNDDKEKNVFLVTVWQYKGKGIKDYRVKEWSYYWDAEEEKPRWKQTNYIDYHDQMIVIGAIQSQWKETLKQSSKQ